jgi:peptidoglycan/LPS O-acetylase OafA/YrhL
MHVELLNPPSPRSAFERGDRPESHHSKNYRRDIDGLRAIAVASVVAYHARLFLFHGGYVGVDIFFVISGYLIGAHVYKDVRHDRFSIGAFYRLRAKRILPALFVVLFFCYALAVLVLDGPELRNFGQYAVATVGSASNMLAWLKSGYFAAGAGQNPLLMTWSLGVEEQFYVIFPLLMLFFGRIGRGKLLAATIAVTLLSFALSVVGMHRNPTATFYLLPTRAWELSVGIFLAIYEADRPVERLYGGGRFANLSGLLGLALLVTSIVAYTGNTVFPGVAAAVPVLGSALILISSKGWVNRFLLSSRPFVFLGLVSYSWYLWHWPLLSFASIATDHPISKISGAAIGLVSLGIAWVSYRFVEQPFRKSETPTAPLLIRYAGLCIVTLLPALAFVALKGWPQRFPELTAIEQQSGILSEDTCLVGFGVAAPDLSKHCVPEDDPRDGVALLGDSHAGALGEALREMTAAANLKLYQITKSACPPLQGVTRLMPNHPAHARECADFNARALEIVRRDRTVNTVVLAGYWSVTFGERSPGSRYQPIGQTSPATPTESAANLSRGLSDLIAGFHSSGKRVLVIKDDPLFAFDPVRRLRSSFIPVRATMARLVQPGYKMEATVPRHELVSREDDIASAIVEQAAGTSATIFDLKKNLCDREVCIVYADGRLFYVDAEHLSISGATRALQGLPLPTISLAASPELATERPAN